MIVNVALQCLWRTIRLCNFDQHLKTPHESRGHSQQPRHDSRAHKQNDRVHAEDHERLCPPFVAFYINQPITQSEKLQRQAAGEENIRAGPERLVDWKPCVPRPAHAHAANARDENVRDLFDGRSFFAADQMTGENTEQRRRQRTHRAQEAFGIVNDSLLPDVRTKNFAIDNRCKTSFFAQVTNVIAGPVNVLHQNEIDNEKSKSDDRLRARPGFNENDRREEVTNRYALQHARNPNRREMKVRKAGEEFSEQEDNHRAIKNLEKEGLEFVTTLDALTKAERDRYADDEQKEWKDQVSWRPAIPFSVFQRPVDVRPRTGIVHQNHPDDRQAAKDVERNEAVVVRHEDCPQISQIPQNWKEQGDDVVGYAL